MSTCDILNVSFFIQISKRDQTQWTATNYSYKIWHNASWVIFGSDQTSWLSCFSFLSKTLCKHISVIIFLPRKTHNFPKSTRTKVGLIYTSPPSRWCHTLSTLPSAMALRLTCWLSAHKALEDVKAWCLSLQACPWCKTSLSCLLMWAYFWV